LSLLPTFAIKPASASGPIIREEEAAVDRLEVTNRWNKQRDRSAIGNLPQWFSWRVTKKLARWSGQPRKRETKLFWGQPMTIVYPEYVSSKIGRYGYFETDMTSMFIDVLRPGMIVYDVGSHFGYFSMLASELVGENGHIYAFEPTANTFGVLSENAARRENITCNNIAAFRETCEITFHDQGLDDSSLNFIVSEEQAVDSDCGGQLITVPAVKLDEFAEQHVYPDFLKIDAEGAEGPILEGMTEIIERSHPGISLEMGDQVCQKTGNKPCRENVEFLMDHGYEVFDYRNCRAERHETMSNYSYDNLFFRHPQWGFAARKAA
jgi:FkbM family methyltransferase